MKLNSRDRNLLVILAAIIIFYLCYTFIMVPSLDKADLLKGEIETTKAEITRAEDLANKEDELKKQEKELREELLEKYSVYFTDLNQANVLNRLDNMMYGTGLNITSYTPSEVSVSQVLVETGGYVPPEYPLLSVARNINPELHQEPNPEQVVSAGAPVAGGEEGSAEAGVSDGSSDSIPCLELMINYDGLAYETVFSFISALERMNKTVLVRSLDFAKSEGPGLQGQMILDLYSLPRFDESQRDELEFAPIIPQGKPNPFN